MINPRKATAEDALHKAIQVRTEKQLDAKRPIFIYELCDQFNVEVKFVDIGSMEGIYVREPKPTILLSAFRPLPRRNFTCAHELGHYIYKHGSTIDALIEDTQKSQDPKEELVDSFAGFLLMPPLAVRLAFHSRGWKPDSATPLQIFIIACSFGVGYETLINHMTYALKMLNRAKAELLLKVKPKNIRTDFLGYSSIHPLVIADENWLMPTVDVEEGTQILLPKDVEAANDRIIFKQEHHLGKLFQAERCGVVRVYSQETQWAALVRISKYQWCGLSKYRHFPEVHEDE